MSTRVYVGFSRDGSEMKMMATVGSTTVLKARFSSTPSHPRAFQWLLEALALWEGQPVHAVLCVDGAVDAYGRDILRDWFPRALDLVIDMKDVEGPRSRWLNAQPGLAAEPGAVGQTRRASSICFTAMRHTNHGDDDDRIVHLIQDAIVTLSYSVAVLAGQLLRTFRSRVDGKRLNLRDELLPILARNVLELLRRRPLDRDAIACHGA